MAADLLLFAGFGGVIAGTALLLTLPQDELRPITLLGAFSLMGFGLGVASVSSTTAGTVAVAAGERGVAAGLLNSTAQPCLEQQHDLGSEIADLALR